MRRSRRARQYRRPPSGTSRSGAISITSPSSSGTPSVSTSDIIGPIWRSGKFTTASTTADEILEAVVPGDLGRGLLDADRRAEVDRQLEGGLARLRKRLGGDHPADADVDL